MPPAAADATPRRLRLVTLGLFCAFQGLYLLLASGRGRTVDEHSLHFMAESLRHEGHLAVPQMLGAGLFFGRVGNDGRPYSPYGPGQPLLAVPYSLVVGDPLAAASPPQARLLAREAATSLVSTTAAAGTTALLFRLAVLAGASVSLALVAAVTTGLATLLMTYASHGFAEPLLALLSLAALLALLRGLESGNLRCLALASAFAGYAFLAKFLGGALLVVSLGAAYLVTRRARPRWRELVALAVPFGLFAGAYLMLNQVRFGDPLQFGYPEIGERGRPLLAFSTPLLTGLYILLASPGKGVFLFAPPLLLALLGLRGLARRQPALAAAVFVHGLATLLVYARYTLLEGGYCFGPRYLLPAVPGFFVALPWALERLASRRVLLAALAVIGLAVQLVGVSTSFLEDQAGPGARYYDARYFYRLDYSIAGQVALLRHYLAEALAGRLWDSPLGLGLDFWFVLLGKAGTDPRVLWLWAATGLAFVGLGVALVRRGSRAPATPPPAA